MLCCFAFYKGGTWLDLTGQQGENTKLFWGTPIPFPVPLSLLRNTC